MCRTSALALTLRRLLDALGLAGAVLDRRGMLLCETSAFRTAARDADTREALLRSARTMARGPAGLMEQRTARRPHPRHKEQMEVRTGTIRYLLRRLLIDTSGADGASCTAALVVVTLEVDCSGQSPSDVLRERIGLTPREVEVALLLTDGLSIPEIGRRLGVSAHTIRHHGERVFRKLTVTSRAAAERRIRTIVDQVNGSHSGLVGPVPTDGHADGVRSP